MRRNETVQLVGGLYNGGSYSKSSALHLRTEMGLAQLRLKFSVLLGGQFVGGLYADFVKKNVCRERIGAKLD